MSRATLPGPLSRLAGILSGRAVRDVGAVQAALYATEKGKADTLLATLGNNDLANVGPLQTLINDAAALAAEAPPKYAEALVKLGQCAAANTAALAAATLLGKARAKYVAILPKATAARDKLKAKKLPTQDFHTELETMLTQADTLVGQKKFQEAFDKLVPYKEKYTAAWQLYQTAVRASLTPDARAQAEQLDSARYKPIYEQRLSQVQEGVARLKRLPHTGTFTTQIDALIDEALALATPPGGAQPNYDAAFRKLAAYTRLSTEAQAAHDRAAGQVGGPEYQAALTEWRAALRTAKPKLTPAEHDRLETAGLAIAQTAATAHEANPRAPATAHTANLRAQTLAITQAAAAVDAGLAAGNRQLETFRGVLTEFNTVADAPVVAPHQVELQNGEVLVGLKKFPEATALFTRAIPAAQTAMAAEKAKKTAWEQALAALNPLPTRLRAVVADQAPSNKANQAKAAKLVNTLDAAVALAAAKKYTEAQAKLASAAIDETKVAALEAERTFGGKFTAQITQIDQELTALAVRNDDQLTLLTNAGGAAGPFKKEIKAATDTWEKVKRDAFTQDTADPARETKTRGKLTVAGDDVKREMQRIFSEIGSTIVTPGKLAANKQVGDADAAGEAADAAITALKEFDLAGARGFGRRLTAALANADAAAKLRELQAIKTEADAARTAQSGRLAGARRTANVTAAAIQTRIDTLKSQSKKYAAYFAKVQVELDELKAMVASTVEDVVAQGNAGLTTLRVKVDAMPDYTLVKAKKEIIKAKLGDDHLKTVMKKRLKTLEAEFKELRKSILAQAPTEALATLNGFLTNTVQPAVDAAAAAAAKRTTISARVTAVKAVVAAAKGDLLADTPQFVAQLEARVKAAEKIAEGSEDLVLARLQAVEDEISVCRSRPELRITKEQQTVQANFDQQRAQSEWQGKFTVFEQVPYKKAKEALEATLETERDKGGAKQLEKLYKEMKKFAKQKNFDAATVRLDEGTLLANRLAANPQGARATARGQLPKVNNAWKDVASTFSAGVNALADRVASFNAAAKGAADPGALDDPKAAKLNAQLRKLAQTFNPLAFEAIITTMTTKTKPLQERRAAREQGLREVRRFTQLAKADPLAKELVSNPFGIAVDIEPLRRKLADLDLNLQRGL